MRLIDADAVLIEIGGGYIDVDAESFLSAPSIEIVYCVECRYKGMEICPMYKLTKAGVLKPYDFCSYGEKKDNEGYN